MATQIKLRGGTTSQHSSFTGSAREVTVDTDKNTIVVHDGSTAGGFPVVGRDASGNASFADSEKAQFGTGNDLQIYHDNTNSYVKEEGTGELRLGSNNAVRITKHDSETLAVFSADGACELLYDNGVKLATTSTGVDITGTALTDGVTVDGTLDIEEVYEKFNSSSSTSGTLAYETNAYGILYLTANQTANRTINFTNVNSNLAIGQTLTCTVLATQGSTAYYFNAYQVDGTAVTPKWSGGTAPSAGNASSIDVYTFTIVKTADATFTVLASQIQYA